MRVCEEIACFRWLLGICFLAYCGTAVQGADHPALAAKPSSYQPQLAPPSHEGELAIQRFRMAPGLRAQLVASEPDVANPVALWIDTQLQIYVAETYRQVSGVPDLRGMPGGLNDDLASNSVEDRLVTLKRQFKEKFPRLGVDHDRIKLLKNRDSSGRYRTSVVFADGFHDPLDGTGAGVLARHGLVWYTCIPHLWQLQDKDGDGFAETRKILHSGYGCRVAFRGHDLHGLRFGPDGRLYFTIGDRGMNVRTQEGTTLAYPDQGTVLRCNPDGSHLEVFATGLRNPQELAFDNHGNLFTGDNNSDSGDKARWVYLVPGGDSGWRMSLQYIPDRGPWNREKLWYPQWDGQSASIIPPLANLGDGPSGITFYPGTGLPERYQQHFFFCDFRGSEGQSGIRSFALKPRGAGFELTDEHQFLWSVLATDCDFGPDSALYVADWVHGWNGEGKGRIYKVTDAAHSSSPLVKRTATLLQAGFTQLSAAELAQLLEHPNRDVRQEAQFELADRGQSSLSVLTVLAARSSHQIARLHALWAIGQIARKHPAALASLVPLLRDRQAEVRGQTAKVLGDENYRAAADAILPLLQDPEPRVRFFAALAAGKLAGKAAIEPVLRVLQENADRDPFLRHAAVMGLAATGDANGMLARADDPHPSVRLGILLALRRMARVEVARFLHDPQPRLVDEAARAISDEPIPSAWESLAGLYLRSRSQGKSLSEPVLYRVLNANFLLGQPRHAEVLAAMAASADLPAAIRVEALHSLADWNHPLPRDRVQWRYWPLVPRSAEVAPAALQSHWTGIEAAPQAVQAAALELVIQQRLVQKAPWLQRLACDERQSAELRVAALTGLDTLQPTAADLLLEPLSADHMPRVRATARSLLARRQPQVAVGILERVLKQGEMVEQQQALRTLGIIQRPEVEPLLIECFDRIGRRDFPETLLLELLEAARQRKDPRVRQRLAQFETSRARLNSVAKSQETLHGGNSENGRKIFLAASDTACVRCHKVGTRGGEVGPELTKIGSQKTREYLLESILEPNKQIAQGYETLVLQMRSGRVYSGIVKQKTEKELRLVQPDNSSLTLARAEIEEQNPGKSAMPEDLVKHLSKSDLRDLIEFLATQK